MGATDSERGKQRMTGMRIYLALAIGLFSLSPAAAGEAPKLVLSHTGFTLGSRHASFNKTSRTDAIALASLALGRPVATGSHGDCGQGQVIGFAKFRGDFELSFVGGRLSGWTEDGPALATGNGIRVGSKVAALRKAYPDTYTDAGDEANGGLGPSFQSETGPSGWLDGVKPTSKIAGLFAGTTCLSGV